MDQSYQEVSRIILEELIKNPVDFKKENNQTYFYNLKLENSKKYERLFFDTNGHEPFSEDLSSIFMDFKICGFLDFDNKIIPQSKERIINYLKEHKIAIQ